MTKYLCNCIKLKKYLVIERFMLIYKICTTIDFTFHYYSLFVKY